MKLGDYILRVRARLTDMRQPDNTFITSADLDGKRWTANKLLDICKDAIAESSRLISTYSSAPVMLQLGAQSTVAEVKYTLSNGRVALPSNVLTILSVVKVDGEPYGYIPPHLYAQYLADSSSPRAGEKFYTVLYDLTTDRRKLAVMPTGNFQVTTYIRYNDTNFSMLDLNKRVPLFGLDDFLVDIAEREAREQEGNMIRAQILDNRISIKLGVGGRK